MKTTLLSTLIIALLSGLVYGARAPELRFAEEPGSGMSANCYKLMPIRPQLGRATESLDLQAKSAYWLGNYKLAAELFQRLLKSGCKDCNNIYNLACCYGQLGDVLEAVLYIRRSVEAGFNDIDHIKNDPDFQNVRESPYFRATMDWLGREVSSRNGR